MPTFEGKTEAGAPIIGAKFWKKGVSIRGTVTGVFDTRVGKAYNLKLMDEISVPGPFLSPATKGVVKGLQWSVGALKGFEMAIRASGCGQLQVGDYVEISCTGSESTTKGNDRVDFAIKVDRK